MSMAKAMGLFRDSQAPSLLYGPRTDVPAKPLSHRPCCQYQQTYYKNNHVVWRQTQYDATDNNNNVSQLWNQR